MKTRNSKLLILFLIVSMLCISTFSVNPNFITEKYEDDSPIQSSEADNSNSGIFDGMYLSYSSELGIGGMSNSQANISYFYEGSNIFNVSTESNGGLIGEGSWDVNNETRMVDWDEKISPIQNNSHSFFWIFPNVSIGDQVPISFLDSDRLFNVSGEASYFIYGHGYVDVWVLEDPNSPDNCSWYEKNTGILINGTFLIDYPMYSEHVLFTIDLIDTNADVKPNLPDHDLKVSLDIPPFLTVDNSFLINATIENWGNYTENNVEFFIYLDGIQVNDTIFTSLERWETKILHFNWTPSDYGTYNFTAFTPSLSGEEIVKNNERIEFIQIRHSQLFDGLEHYVKVSQDPPSYGYGEGQYRLFNYTKITESKYKLEQHEFNGKTYNGESESYYYLTDSNTGKMYFVDDDSHIDSGYEGAIDQYYWILNDTKLGDLFELNIIPFRWTFNVTRERKYNLTGFGEIDVWELESLSDPKNRIWYEKKTGLLVNFSLSIFLYDDLITASMETFYTNALKLEKLTWTPEPQDIKYSKFTYYNEPNPFEYKISAKSPFEIDEYWINESTNFKINNETGFIRNNTILDKTNYWIKVRVNDTNGKSLEKVIKIIICSPPEWDPEPTDQIVEYGEPFRYYVNANCTCGIDRYRLTFYDYRPREFDINSTTGLITNKSILTPGIYELNIEAVVFISFEYGNTIEKTIQVTVQDTTEPIWDSEPRDQIVKFGKAFYYNINATDLSPINYFINDTNGRFIIDSTTGEIQNITALDLGKYHLNITAQDKYGNSKSALIIITVEAASIPNPEIPGYPCFILISFAIIVIYFLKKKLSNKTSVKLL